MGTASQWPVDCGRYDIQVIKVNVKLYKIKVIIVKD